MVLPPSIAEEELESIIIVSLFKLVDKSVVIELSSSIGVVRISSSLVSCSSIVSVSLSDDWVGTKLLLPIKSSGTTILISSAVTFAVKFKGTIVSFRIVSLTGIDSLVMLTMDFSSICTGCSVAIIVTLSSSLAPTSCKMMAGRELLSARISGAV